VSNDHVLNVGLLVVMENTSQTFVKFNGGILMGSVCFFFQKYF